MKQTVNVIVGVAVVLIVAVIVGAQPKPMGTMTAMAEPDINRAIVILHPAKGSNVQGTVIFTKMGDHVMVVADVTGLTPGLHGFHIHQYGDCSAADGTSAGGHFNPENKNHGGPMDSDRHVGDLGNLMADTEGVAHLELMDKQLAFSGPHSFIGRAVVVHGGADDLKSQPSGAAGPRVAYGVVGIAKPAM